MKTEDVKEIFGQRKQVVEPVLEIRKRIRNFGNFSQED